MSPELTPAVAPELGPLLGRLVAPADEPSVAEALLEDVRLRLLTSLFDRGADRSGWLAVWDVAVTGATRAVSAEIEWRLRDAAAVSRYPAKRLSSALPTEEDREMLAARLSAAGIGLEDSMLRHDGASPDSGEAFRRSCGELTAAWERLTATATEELGRWERRAAELRAWRRPWKWLGMAGGLLLALAAWLGLVLGGYLRVPTWLRPLTDWIWNL